MKLIEAIITIKKTDSGGETAVSGHAKRGKISHANAYGVFDGGKLVARIIKRGMGYLQAWQLYDLNSRPIGMDYDNLKKAKEAATKHFEK